MAAAADGEFAEHATVGVGEFEDGAGAVLLAGGSDSGGPDSVFFSGSVCGGGDAAVREHRRGATRAAPPALLHVLRSQPGAHAPRGLGGVVEHAQGRGVARSQVPPHRPAGTRLPMERGHPGGPREPVGGARQRGGLHGERTGDEEGPGAGRRHGPAAPGTPAPPP